jgi:hypothetical protein
MCEDNRVRISFDFVCLELAVAGSQLSLDARRDCTPRAHTIAQKNVSVYSILHLAFVGVLNAPRSERPLFIIMIAEAQRLTWRGGHAC